MNFRKLLLDLWSTPAPAADATQAARALRAESEALAGPASKFLNKTGLFDREHYVKTYGDVAKSGIDPQHHYVRFGILAGRTFTSPEAIARLLDVVLRSAEHDRALASNQHARAIPNASRFRIGLYVSSQGNFFMNEIAALLAAGLQEAGAQPHLLDETGSPGSDLTHKIVIAPHEFFALGEGRRWATDEFLSRAIMFSTEQPQTTWFARSLPYLLRAKLIADLNLQSALVLKRGGLNTICVQPGYSEHFAAFASPNGAAARSLLAAYPAAVRDYDVSKPRSVDRPLDVVFIGSSSPRRDMLLAAFAAAIVDLQSFVHCIPQTAPLRLESHPAASSDVTAGILGRAKILLNVHRDEYAYLEWWRLMQAFWLKTVVVTEACFPHPLFKPGIHFFEEKPSQMASLVRWLATTPEGQAKAEAVRARAYETLVAEASAKSAALRLLEAMSAT